MVWNILRPRVWLLYKQLWDYSPRQRLINAGFLLLLVAGAGYGLNWLGQHLAGPEGAGLLVAFLPTTAMALFFFVLIQLADMLQRLFLSPDLQWLLRAPLARVDIFTAKMIECTLSLWLPVALFAAILLTLGVAQSAPPLYYPLVLVAIASLALIATAVGMLFVFLVASLVPPKRLRELLPVGLGVVSLAGILGQQWMMRELAGWEGAIRMLVAALLDVGQMAGLASILAAVALLGCGMAFLAFHTVYFPIFSRLQVAGSARRPARKDRKPSVAGRSFFPAKGNYLIEKEWVDLVREPRRLSDLVLIPLMTVVLLLPMLSLDGPFRPLLFWLILVYSGLFGINSGQSAGLATFTLEGRRFAYYRVAPVRMSAVLWSKFWISLVPNMLPWVLVFLVAGGLLGLAAWQIAALIAAILLELAGACAICVTVSAQEADFSTATPSPKLPGPAGLVSLGLCLIWALLVIVIVAGCIFLWAGASDLVAVTFNAVGAIPILGPLFSGGGLLFLAVGLAGVLIFGLVLRRMWVAAVDRLENWEMV